jgi:eukaryotic-like serine/threonine-protein kinase
MNEPARDARCAACDFANLPGSRYCSQCGVQIGNAEAPASRNSREVELAPASAADSGVDARASAEHMADPLIGVVIAGRYRIVEPIGRGGMGVVYKVEHARIGKLMALKLLTGELSRDQELVGRFKREALMVSKLSHPNTVQVFDYGAAEGITYLAMEYLRGDDLGRIIRKTGPLSPERTAKIVIQICSSLAEAHDLDIVHRDLKPENIMIIRGHSDSDLVKVLDFGLAKLRESTELGEVTTRGAIVGTPYYMAPEQIRGEAADQRSDIYALGALMYACLTARPVFDAPRPMGVLTKHLTEAPQSPSARFPELAIPARMSAIVLKALTKESAYRFQHVRELQRALVDELRGEGSPSVDLLLDSGQVQKLTQAGEDLATRDEVESYERKLRRRGQFVWGALAVGVLAGGLLGWRLMDRVGAHAGFSGLEREPNNSPAEATPLPFGQEVIGQLGARLDPHTSDRDFYRVDVPEGVRAVRIKTGALPNMALCTFVYRVGTESPIGRYCTGRAARELTIDALELAPGGYLIAVMQDRNDGEIPVLENVSDSYRLRVEQVEIAPDRELEPNDSPRDANRVVPGTIFRGRLSWMRDIDAVCVEGSGKVQFVVEDAPGSARPPHAVLEVTPRGGPADGIPVRVHRQGASPPGKERDAISPWTSPEVDASSGNVCLVLQLVVNPWAPTPHPRVAPASDEEYIVRVEQL